MLERFRRPDLPDWPSILIGSKRIIVIGKHGTPWRHRLLECFVSCSLLLLVIVVIAPALGGHPTALSVVVAVLPLPEWFWLVGLPFVLALLLLSKRLRFRLSPLIFPKRLALEFSPGELVVRRGVGASPRAYSTSDAEISFRVIDHPRAKGAKARERDLNPFTECGRVQMLVGDRRVLIGDIAWRDQAQDFVACLNAALRLSREGTDTPATRQKSEKTDTFQRLE